MRKGNGLDTDTHSTNTNSLDIRQHRTTQKHHQLEVI
jgi:hypothetical protein